MILVVLNNKEIHFCYTHRVVPLLRGGPKPTSRGERERDHNQPRGISLLQKTTKVIKWIHSFTSYCKLIQILSFLTLPYK